MLICFELTALELSSSIFLSWSINFRKFLNIFLLFFWCSMLILNVSEGQLKCYNLNFSGVEKKKKRNNCCRNVHLWVICRFIKTFKFIEPLVSLLQSLHAYWNKKNVDILISKYNYLLLFRMRKKNNSKDDTVQT